jgi:hypothetical protein
MTHTTRDVTLRWHLKRKSRCQWTFIFVLENVTWHFVWSWMSNKICETYTLLPIHAGRRTSKVINNSIQTASLLGSRVLSHTKRTFCWQSLSTTTHVMEQWAGYSYCRGVVFLDLSYILIHMVSLPCPVLESGQYVESVSRIPCLIGIKWSSQYFEPSINGSMILKCALTPFVLCFNDFGPSYFGVF